MGITVVSYTLKDIRDEEVSPAKARHQHFCPFLHVNLISQPPISDRAFAPRRSQSDCPRSDEAARVHNSEATKISGSFDFVLTNPITKSLISC